MVPLASSKRGVASSKLMALLGNTATLPCRMYSLRGVRIWHYNSTAVQQTGQARQLGEPLTQVPQPLHRSLGHKCHSRFATATDTSAEAVWLQPELSQHPAHVHTAPHKPSDAKGRRTAWTARDAEHISCTKGANSQLPSVEEALGRCLTAYLSPKMVPALPRFMSWPFFSTARWNLQQQQQQQPASCR
eukprot:GHRQ01038109.1.p1 GENE.GHRQ01038109.1~~GHRQ01038109.1.p1  ORF type:complete len:189 (-),score=26.26 GHRQ01038109.1:50-616(-)